MAWKKKEDTEKKVSVSKVDKSEIEDLKRQIKELEEMQDDDVEEDEESDDDDSEVPDIKPAKYNKLDYKQILFNHEERLRSLEATLYRLRNL